MAENYNNEFASTSDYYKTIYSILSDPSTWNNNITISDITQLMKKALDKTEIKKAITEMVQNKLEKLQPTFQALKDTLNIQVKQPNDVEISSYVDKICKALTDIHKKTDKIKIDNLITASYVRIKRPIPD